MKAKVDKAHKSNCNCNLGSVVKLNKFYSTCELKSVSDLQETLGCAVGIVENHLPNKKQMLNAQKKVQLSIHQPNPRPKLALVFFLLLLANGFRNSAVLCFANRIHD